MNKKRIACVLIENFALELCFKENAALRDRPVALADSESEAASVLEVNAAAAQDGVAAEMTVAQAHTRCPELVVKVRDEKKERAESDKLFHSLMSVSPFVETAGPGIYFADAAGLERLYQNEEGLGERIIALVKAFRYPVKVGIAKSKFVARVAAGVGEVDAFNIVVTGAEKTFLGQLTAQHLPLDNETGATLSDLGLHTIGQLAAFPQNEMSHRFGQQGTTLARLSRGDDTEFFTPELPPEKISQRLSLIDPLYNAAAVVHQVKQLLNGLLEDLRRLDLGCGRIVVVLYLDNSNYRKIDIALKQPVMSPGKFIRQLKSRLEKTKLTAGITDIVLTIPEITGITSAQLELGPATKAPSEHTNKSGSATNATATTLYAPRMNHHLIPEKNFSLLPTGEKGATKKKKQNDTKIPWPHPYSIHPPAGLRLYQPAHRTNVTLQDGRLRLLKYKKQIANIVRQQGPWEISGQWWSDAFDRLYFQVQTEDNRFYLLYFDRASSDWYLQGSFD